MKNDEIFHRNLLKLQNTTGQHSHLIRALDVDFSTNKLIKNEMNVHKKIEKKIIETDGQAPNQQSPKIENKTKKSEDNKDRNEIKNLFKNTFYTHLAQAIINLISTPYLIIKIFLAIFVLISSCLASYLVIGSIIEYLRFEVNTKSRNIYETTTLFPKVTFCNVNYYATKYAFNLTQKGIYTGSNLSNEEMKKLGHSLEDILVYCSFNLNPCNSSDFVWSFDPSYGNCYIFNSGFDSKGNQIDLKKSTSSDPWAGGLYLTFYIDIYEELMNLDQNILATMMVGRGAIIQIDNSSYTTYHSNHGVLLSAGTASFLSVEREFKTILHKPYSNCEIGLNSPNIDLNNQIYNLIARSEYGYTQQFCMAQCMQKQFIDKYNCTYPYFPTLFNISACDWELDKINFNWDQISNSEFTNQLCLSLCPLECNQTFYRTSVSSVKLIGSYLESKIKNNPSLASDFINRTIDSTTATGSFVSVYIFYDSLSYTETTESPQMDLVSLLGSIGGNLGLFLGVNMFSLCEIIEVALEIIFIMKKNEINIY